MQQTSAAQQRPGEKSASTPDATQNKLMTPSNRMTLKHPSCQYQNTNGAGQSTSGEAAANVIIIRDTPSPPQQTGLTTPATEWATQ